MLQKPRQAPVACGPHCFQCDFTLLWKTVAGASGSQEGTLEKAKEMLTDSETGGASSDNQQTTKNVQGN